MKKRICGFLLLLIVFLMTGCKQEKASTSEAENVYKIYYMNTSMMKLAPMEYAAQSQNQADLIQELMNQFLNVPNDVDRQEALPDKVGYLGYRHEDKVLYLYFDAGYTNPANMDATREILCRAALTKTMTQIEGVEYVYIYVAEQPLLDLAGKPVGMMAASDFIESVSDVNTFEETSMTLFFADETGQRLVAEEREVVHSMNTSLEKLVVEELMKGPQLGGRFPTLPPDLKLLNVSVNENVCYINFDSAFLNSTLAVAEYIPIYSIVNTVCEISNVNKVQITVNGSQDVKFRDVIDLTTQFERNLEIGETN